MLRLLTLALASCLLLAVVACATKTKPAAPPAAMADNGCWVQIFEDKKMNANGAWDVINGPGEWTTMYGLPGARYQRWDDRIDSLIVGPHAKVTLWLNDYYNDEQVQFGPNARINNLGSYDFDGEAESMKIEYVP